MSQEFAPRSMTAFTWTSQSMSRPNTSALARQSRPVTARPQTAASARLEDHCIIAIFEGRGVSHEVGLAALNRDTGQLMLVQLSDCQTYVKTLHQMHLYSPALILIPDTSFSASDISAPLSGTKGPSASMLLQYMREEFRSVPIEPVNRKYWNDRAGFELITQICVDDDERPATLLASSQKYYALSAACSLLKYAEMKFNTRYAAGSLRIRYIAVEGTVLIDADTTRNLELVNNLSRTSSHSLFGILNHTFTAMASRLLRVNILSPITAQSAIDARLDVVDEFIQTEERFTAVRDALKALNKMDFDKLISSLAMSEASVSNPAKHASSRVSQLLQLQGILRSLPALQRALNGSRSQLLQVIHDMISDERLRSIADLICSHLNEDNAPAKGGISAVNARVYAIKANCNRLLDVARETYKENVGDIFQLNRNLSEKHSLVMSLVYQDCGFVFAVKKADLEDELPPGFINVSVQKGRYLFSSIELKKMNARMKDALDETLILSDRIVQDLLSQILVDIGALYKVSEAVALVDMLWSFAHASIMRNYVRPEFTGTLAIKSGRHPILEGLQSAGTLVPNDIYCDNSSFFQLIRGPNMSGKSTYLRQIGLLSVMAMCGCFVPADYASFRIHDAILTRLSNEDDAEKNLSTFASEMASSAMILGLATADSLVLIDELGRGTSPTEGIGIAHAIAETLIKIQPFVFFATHFSELTATLSRQPCVVSLHLSVQKSFSSTSNIGMTFHYRVVDGAPEDQDHYGLEIARLADLPSGVLVQAKEVAMKLVALDTQQKERSRTTRTEERRKALLRLRTQLTQALDHSTLPDRELLEYLSQFQNDVAKAFLHD